MHEEYEEVFLYGTANTEEEQPLEQNSSIDKLEELKIKAEVDEKKRKEKRYFSAFKLIVGCLIFLGAVYVVDVITSGFIKKELSSTTDNIIEIIKTLLFTLSGYLFARKENGD